MAVGSPTQSPNEVVVVVGDEREILPGESSMCGSSLSTAEASISAVQRHSVESQQSDTTWRDLRPARLSEGGMTPQRGVVYPTLTERETRFELFGVGRDEDDERITGVGLRRMRESDAGIQGVMHRFQKAIALSPTASAGDKDEDEDKPKYAAPDKLGTFMGVFLPCLQNILGIILFIRLSWIVGQAGIGVSLAIVGMCCSSTLLTGLSLSAIATNGVMKGGGPYFLIGRALGPEVGVSIGVCFYLATTTAASMYILGAAETIYNQYPSLMTYSNNDEAGIDIRDMQILGVAILGVLAFLVVLGVKYISKLAPLFLIPVLLSVAFIHIGIYVANDSTREGITGLSGATFADNWHPDFKRTDPQGNPDPDGDATWSFQTLLALFYPSVSGMMAGSNRSASLRDPQASIPVGTLGAIFVTSTLYLVSVFLYGSVASRDYLLTERLMSAKVSWPAEQVVALGITLSTLGAGLQSLVGAPRLMAAMANDRILPFLDYFIVQEGEEPRRALLLTVTITLAGVLVGNLDLITPIITMFFLLCYLGVNMSCTMLSLINAPSWRPRWRYYHWSLSLLGFLLCLTIMFLISWLFSILALALAVVLYMYVSENGNAENWGDGMKSLRLHFALKTLAGMDQHVHPKNWYPIPLVLCKPWGIIPESMPCHPKLLSFAKYLHQTGDKGCAFVISIMTGDYGSRAEDAYHATKRLRDHIEESEATDFVSGFSDVIVAPSVAEGFRSLIQTIGMGQLRPNLVMMRYPDQWSQATTAEKIPQQFISIVRDCYTAGKGLIMIHGLDSFPVEGKCVWTGLGRRRSSVPDFEKLVADGGESGDSDHPDDLEGDDTAHETIDTEGRSSLFQRLLTCIPGFSDQTSHSTTRLPTGTIDLYWITRDGGLMLLLGQMLASKTSIWRKCEVRVFAVADDEHDQEALKQDVQKFLYDLRMDGTVIVLSAHNSDVCCECNQRRSDIMHKFEKARKRILTKNNLPLKALKIPDTLSGDKHRNPKEHMELLEDESALFQTSDIGGTADESASKQPVVQPTHDSVEDPSTKAFSKRPPPLAMDNARFSEDVIASPKFTPTEQKVLKIEKYIFTSLKLNATIRMQSKNAALVLLSLPPPPPEEDLPYNYMEYMDLLIKDIPRALLVRGYRRNVVTLFS